MKWFPKREKMNTALSVIESLWLYWFVTILMISAGGLLVHMYIKTGIKFNEYLAVNIGATAPLVLGLITEKTPNIRPLLPSHK
jgi:hypothetical protein